MIRPVTSMAAVAMAIFSAPAAAQNAPHENPAAAEFAGMWNVGFETNAGFNEFDLALEIDGGEILGKAATANLSGYEFEVEGRQAGDRLDFVVLIDIPDHEVELYFSGVIEGDKAEGEVLVMGQTFLWSGERAR